MATLLLSAAGAAIGAGFGGTVLGLSGAVIGRALGATLGQAIDQRVLGAGSDAVEAGRIDRLRLHSTGEGQAIAEVWGRMRVAGHVIWASDFEEHQTVTTHRQRGAKGGGGRSHETHVTEYSYSVSLALGLCRGEILRLGRIWADGMEISAQSLNMRLYKGGEDQLPDAKIVAIEGAARSPAFRGLAYVVIEGLDLTPFGNRLPQLSFEVFRNAQGGGEKADPQDNQAEEAVLSDLIQAVDLIPGTGEYALATTPVYLQHGPAMSVAQNCNSPSGQSDFATSLMQLREELPRCKSVGLVVSWFGDDLRCGSCEIRPKVEQKEAEAQNMPWRAGGINRAAAQRLALRDGRVIYGGTPTDQSVIEAMKAIRAAGCEVMFYPFILMEQLAGNGRENPWAESGEQPALPWRGRITGSKARGFSQSPYGTEAIRNEVADFFGTASASDFTPAGDHVTYSGPNEWRYRRFILHYAHLCALAGGVDTFCIGSEMVGLTRLKDHENRFPAVEALMVLAGEVRAILGPDCDITYAADWTEYGAYSDGDDLHFPLDPLWAHTAISCIGIDNYMPIADWREGDGHKDAHWGAIWNLEYLKSNIAGGEGFDWYYDGASGAAHQNRHAIEDGAYGEDWVIRVKDLRGWWENLHYPRLAGVRAEAPSPWVARSKPLRFTEYGCAAIDKGANQPNRFWDKYSSESALPRASLGGRDDFMQLQYLRAMASFWQDSRHNPAAPLKGGRMLDFARSHVWAWDARPFPHFPARADLWGDGAHYMCGHWLNGRATNQPVGAVLREICHAAGLRHLNTEQAFGIIRGYSLRELGTARAQLQPLLQAAGLDAFEKGGHLCFRSRLPGVDHDIDPAFCADDGADGGGFDHTRLSAAETGTTLRISYVEAEANYEMRMAEARHPAEAQLRVAGSELALALTLEEARAMAMRWLAETRIGRDRLSFNLPPSRREIGIADRLRSPDGALWRVERIEAGMVRKIEAVRIESAVYRHGLIDAAGGGGMQPLLAPFIAPSPALAVVMDLPLLSGREEAHQPYLAVSAVPWSGAMGLWRASADEGFTLARRITRPSVMGVSESELSRGGFGYWARQQSLRLRLYSGGLSGQSKINVLNGANVLAIGDGSSSQWEIIQFQEAELVAPHTYVLRGLLRGQAGSEAMIPDLWPRGSTVVLLDDGPTQIDIAPEALGLSRSFRVGPLSLGPNVPQVRHIDLETQGIGLRPYRIVHPRLKGRAGEEIHVQWIRRSRVGGDNWQQFEVPLAEEFEAYLVEVWREGAVVARYQTDRPSFTYPAAQQAADGVSAPFYLNVAQISAKFGPGPFRQIAVSG